MCRAPSPCLYLHRSAALRLKSPKLLSITSSSGMHCSVVRKSHDRALNLTVKRELWMDVLREIEAQGERYGLAKWGRDGECSWSMSAPIRPGRCMSGMAAVLLWGKR